jgi:hypothetical protein
MVVTGAGPSTETRRGMREPSTTTSDSAALSATVASLFEEIEGAGPVWAAAAMPIRLVPTANARTHDETRRIFIPPLNSYCDIMGDVFNDLP